MKKVAVILTAGLLCAPASTASADHEWLCNGSLDMVIIHGTARADSLQGTVFEFECWNGGAGDDVAWSAGGFDSLLGGRGNDTFHAESGGDAVNGQGGADVIQGGPGPDREFGGDGVDEVRGNRGADNVFGGGFCVETTYWGFIDDVPVDHPLPTCNEGDEGDQLFGGPGDDWIWESNSGEQGDGFVDTIDGGEGWDICTVEPQDIVTNCEDVRLI